MHTTFISTNLTLGVSVTRGDIVTVELKKSGQTYELEYGRFLELSARENPGDAAKTECFALKDLVGGWEAPAVGEGMPTTTATTDTSTTASISTAANPRLIYFYPGMRYGTKAFVQDKINSIGVPSDVIIIVGASHSTPFSVLQADAQKALSGRTPSDIKLGGWSGGGRGVALALGSGTAFSTIIYADPEPHRLLGKSHTNAKMYYRPENWGNSSIRSKLTQLAGEMGAKAQLVTESHDEILVKALKELIS